MHRLNEDLTFFNRVKSKIENKDLLTYDTLKSVYDAIRPFQENENSIQQLYSFLEVKELPLTTDGCFLAYRGLRSDYYSRQGNTKTKVLKGKVDEHGHIVS